MFKEKATSTDLVSSAVQKGKGVTDGLSGGGVFTVKCLDKDGNLKWEAQSPNLVVNVGLGDMTDKYFNGSTYTASWYIGLYGAAASNDPAASDTMSSHAGWTENTDYSEPARQLCVFGASDISSVSGTSTISNSASTADFSMNPAAPGVTIGGAFLTDDSAKGGASGILFSASDFQSPGDRSVVSGDTIKVTYTFNLNAL